MSNHRMSTPEASKALGIPVHVITYWLGQIPYPAEQDEKGEWRLTPEAMAVLETVRDLKGQNRSMETIRRHVKELQDVPPAPAPAARRPAPGRTQVAVEAAPEAGAADQPRMAAGGVPAAPPRQAPPKTPRPAEAPPQGPRPAEPAPRPAEAGPRPAEPQAQAPRAPEGARPANRPPNPNARKGNPPPATPPSGQMQPAPPARPPVPAHGAPMPPGGQDLASHVARAVTEAVRQETMLAQRYAHAAHQIGKLEAENEHLRAMLTAATAKHGRDLDEARCRIAELEARPAPKPRTSWWAWLTIAVML